MAQVREWFDAARAAGVHEPEAAALATASPDGRPSVRIVLIRGIDERGVSWYTNRESRKGRELAANPRAAVAFHWAALERQVRLEGPVELLSDAESDAYFAGRPHMSRIGAWASRQGTVIPDMAHLDARVAEFAARYPGRGAAARRTGAATCCGPTRSSSGRGGRTGCTTGSTTCARATAGATERLAP